MTDAKFTGEYEVTADGRVLSLTGWRGQGVRELRQTIESGYPCVRLVALGRRVRFLVHRLVAAGYLPDAPTLAHQVRHLDGNPLNRDWRNLAWGTAAENAADRTAHGRAHAVTNPRRAMKLSVSDVTAIRARYAKGERIAAIHKSYPNCTAEHIGSIARGKHRRLG